MLSLTIKDTKKMLATLLDSASFDKFFLQEVSVTTDISLFLEGSPNTGYALYGKYRKMISDFMSDETMPASFKFVLQAPAAYTANLLTKCDYSYDPETVNALILIFRYENETLTCLTGVSYTTFVPDKSAEHFWDKDIKKSFSNLQIQFEDPLF